MRGAHIVAQKKILRRKTPSEESTMNESGYKQECEIAKCLLKASRTVRVEGEGTLPDYTDDIHRVLQSDARVTVSRKRLYSSEGRLYCELGGIVNVVAICRGEDGGQVTDLFSHTFTQEFSEQFEVGEGTEVPEPYHLTCRVQNTQAHVRQSGKKRCNYHATFQVCGELFANETLEYFSGEQGVETRTKLVKTSRLVSAREETFEVEEEIELSENLPPILDLVDSSITLCSLAQKVAGDTAQLSFAAKFYCAYRSEEEEGEGRLVSFVKPMEIRESLLLGADVREAGLQTSVLPLSLVAEAGADRFGVQKSVRLRLTYAVTSAVYEEAQVPLVTDAYCIGRPCEMQFEERGLPLVGPFSYGESKQKLTFASETVFSAVENCRAKASVKEMRVENGDVVLCAQVRITALGVRQEDGKVISVEVSEDCDFVFLNCVPTQGEVLLRDTVCSVQLSEEGAQLTADVTLQAAYVVCREEKEEYVTDFVELEGEGEPFCGVRFYYPAPEESLWEIARAHRVSVSSLEQENGIRQDAPLPNMLMITL